MQPAGPAEPASVADVSPLARSRRRRRTDVDQIVDITAEAMAELVDAARHRARRRPARPAAGDRQQAGRGFRYDLSFDVVTKAAFTDEVRTSQRRATASRSSSRRGDLDLLQGATLDHTDSQGLVIRNPNKPKAPVGRGARPATTRSAPRSRRSSPAEVNPALAAHGGFVTYVGHDGEGTVYMTMGGGCHGCSMSQMTMLDGVQTMLVEQIPAVERVKDLTDHATGENPFYMPISALALRRASPSAAANTAPI